MNTFSGPMFEPAEDAFAKSSFNKQGAHYNIFAFRDPDKALEYLKSLFPDGTCNELNLVIFSTSGVHGMYTTLEEIEAGLQKYGDNPDFADGDEGPDDWCGDEVTVTVYHPRIVCLRYGQLRVKLSDLPWLKQLRASSYAAFLTIGASP